MSCISSNFSSFFLDSLNDPSEFAKYLSNGENKAQNTEDFQLYGGGNGSISGSSGLTVNGIIVNNETSLRGEDSFSHHANFLEFNGLPNNNYQSNYSHSQYTVVPQINSQLFNNQIPGRWNPTHNAFLSNNVSSLSSLNDNFNDHLLLDANSQQQTNVTNNFDGSFEFTKYLRSAGDYCEEPHESTMPFAVNNLIDLDSNTSITIRNYRTSSSTTFTTNDRSSLDIDNLDHDSKLNLFDLHHQISSNSNESSCDPMGNFGVHLNTSNSNISSESAGSDNSNNNQNNASKPLTNFSLKDNFEVHPAHKVEEGIFQHMNKLPIKKKDTLKQLGVRFTGQMTLADKSIVVDNFIQFCQEYNVNDHRPFLALNQSGMNKPEQIKFARYLGRGLPSFTLFCIYSNFKNLFCTKRTETYGKDGYNLQCILDKTKHFLSKATADLKNLSTQTASNDGVELSSNNSAIFVKSDKPKVLENLVICENFDVHETHRIEDGVSTHISRLPPKKQELLKQFGIQSAQTVSYYEKYIIIENFIKFCNEYKVIDHRPFLDFHESGVSKLEQLKFVRYLGQGLPTLTLNRIYLAFKDVLGINRIEKITADGYCLELILKKKKKNLYNRMHAAVHRESTEAAKQAHRESLAS